MFGVVVRGREGEGGVGYNNDKDGPRRPLVKQKVVDVFGKLDRDIVK